MYFLRNRVDIAIAAACAFSLFQCATAEPHSKMKHSPKPHTVEYNFFAPKRYCEQQTPQPISLPRVKDNHFAVDVDGAGKVSLASSGTSAAIVLMKISELTKRPMLVQGHGANVRIYAHLLNRSANEVINAIALASGQRGSPPDHFRAFTLISDHTDSKFDGDLQRKPCFPMRNLQLTRIKVKHPVSISRVLRLGLSCCGQITAIPRRSMILVRDFKYAVDVIEDLIKHLESPKHVPWRGEAISRSQVKDLSLYPRCNEVSQYTPNPVSADQRYASGATAGELLRTWAKKEGENIVIGCGGERRAFFVLPEGVGLKKISTALGLFRVRNNSYAYASQGVAARSFGLTNDQNRRKGALLHTYKTRFPREVAAAANNDVLYKDLLAVPYPEMSLIFATGDAFGMGELSRLAADWEGKEEEPGE